MSLPSVVQCPMCSGVVMRRKAMWNVSLVSSSAPSFRSTAIKALEGRARRETPSEGQEKSPLDARKYSQQQIRGIGKNQFRMVP